jgi:hypothetical protein
MAPENTGNLPDQSSCFRPNAAGCWPLPRSGIMPTYLVRTIDDHDLVGIFVAPNILALALLVDE